MHPSLGTCITYFSKPGPVLWNVHFSVWVETCHVIALLQVYRRLFATFRANLEMMTSGNPVQLTLHAVHDDSATKSTTLNPDDSWGTARQGIHTASIWETHLVRTLHGELYFSSRHSVLQMLHLAQLVCASEPGRLQLILQPKMDVGQKHSKTTMTSSTIKLSHPLVRCYGYLIHCHVKNAGTVSFQRRFCVLVDVTVFVYDNQQVFLSGGKAKYCYPIGGHPAYEGKQLGRRCLTLDDKLILVPDDDNDFHRWAAVLDSVHRNRSRSVIVTVVEELVVRTRRHTRAVRGAASTREPGSTHGMKTEGLFRVSGMKDEVDRLVHQWDQADYPKLRCIEDVHSLTGLLKRVLGKQLEPVMTFELYDSWVASIESNQPSQRVQELVQQLPEDHRRLLDYLLAFVSMVMVHADCNKMSSKSLAIVLAPNLLRPKTSSVTTMLRDNSAVISCVQLLIEGSKVDWEPNSG